MTPVESRYALSPVSDPGTEVVLLKGRGCFWKKCVFCNYYEDAAEEDEAAALNDQVLNCVTGETGRLTVINSGSWFELPKRTRERILSILREKKIRVLSTETHWVYHEKTKALEEALCEEGVELRARIGIETFDEDFREDVMRKGIGKGVSPEEIASYYKECCLLYGMKGQSEMKLREDIRIALSLFHQVYLNLYMGGEGLYPEDKALTKDFRRRLEKEFRDQERYPGLVVLSENTDLDVG